MADYDLVGSAQMLQHNERAAACDAAIPMSATPGSVVFELGTGAEFMARLACQCAASHVLWVRIALLCLL
jgi:predicted RNA methylase